MSILAKLLKGLSPASATERWLREAEREADELLMQGGFFSGPPPTTPQQDADEQRKREDEQRQREVALEELLQRFPQGLVKRATSIFEEFVRVADSDGFKAYTAGLIVPAYLEQYRSGYLELVDSLSLITVPLEGSRDAALSDPFCDCFSIRVGKRASVVTLEYRYGVGYPHLDSDDILEFSSSKPVDSTEDVEAVELTDHELRLRVGRFFQRGKAMKGVRTAREAERQVAVYERKLRAIHHSHWG